MNLETAHERDTRDVADTVAALAEKVESLPDAATQSDVTYAVEALQTYLDDRLGQVENTILGAIDALGERLESVGRVVSADAHNTPETFALVVKGEARETRQALAQLAEVWRSEAAETRGEVSRLAAQLQEALAVIDGQARAKTFVDTVVAAPAVKTAPEPSTRVTAASGERPAGTKPWLAQDDEPGAIQTRYVAAYRLARKQVPAAAGVVDLPIEQQWALIAATLNVPAGQAKRLLESSPRLAAARALVGGDAGSVKLLRWLNVVPSGECLPRMGLIAKGARSETLMTDEQRERARAGGWQG